MKKLLSLLFLSLVMIAGCNQFVPPSSSVNNVTTSDQSQVNKDEVLEQIDEILKEFAKNYVSTYINEEKIDYVVVSALRHLNQLDSVLSTANVEAQISKEKLENVNSIGEALKYSVILQSKKIDILTYQGVNLVDKITTINAIGNWASLYGVMALNGVRSDLTQLNLDYVNRALEDMKNASSPKNATVDTGGTTLIALAPFYNDAGVKSVVDEYVNWVSSEEQHINGEVSDVWSGPNSSTIAQVIMGLVANNINPRGDLFTKEEGDLVTALLRYATSDGSFKWQVSDENSDLAFSTPQAILALVVYKQYKLSSKAVNAFIFN